MLQKIKRFSSIPADLLGISASFACLIHCLLFPFAVSLAYILPHSDGIGHWHEIDYLFIGLAILSVYQASKNTNFNEIKIALWVMVSFFASAVLLHDLNPWMILFSSGSSVALVVLHYKNWEMKKNAKA